MGTFFEKRIGQKYITIRVVVGYEKKGQPIRLTRRFPLNTKDKQLNLEALKLKEDYDGYRPRNMSLDELIQEFLEWKADKVAPRTIYNYRREMPLYLKSDLKLDQLNKQNCQALITGSARRRSKSKIYLNQVLNYALDNDYIKQLPGKLNAASTQMRMKPIRILSKDEIKALLSAPSKYLLLYEFLLVSGLRIGEALALERHHLQGNVISVTQSLNFLYKQEVGALKSKHSYRTLSIPDEVAKKLQGKTRKLFNWNYTVICKDFRKITQDLGIYGITLHSLRHTHCTHLLAKGINPVFVSKRLGHHSPAFTLERYTHLVPEMGNGLLEAIKKITE